MTCRIPFLSRVPIIALILPALLLNGCGVLSALTEGDDNREPPAKLESTKDTLQMEQLWSVEVGGSDEEQYLHLRPAFLKGRIYTAGSDGLVTALDADTGQQIWQVQLEVRVVGGVAAGEGLVIVSTGSGDVIALSPDDCLLYTSPSPRDLSTSRMPSSA